MRCRWDDGPAAVAAAASKILGGWVARWAVQVQQNRWLVSCVPNDAGAGKQRLHQRTVRVRAAHFWRAVGQWASLDPCGESPVVRRYGVGWFRLTFN